MIGGGLALNDRIYTGSGNVPYVQSGPVDHFIPEPRCSKSVVGLQTRRGKEGVYKRFGWLRPEGSRSELGGPAVGSVDVYLVSLSLKKSISPGWRERIPFYR